MDRVPFYWAGFGFFSYAALVAIVVTLLISGIFGYVSFRLAGRRRLFRHHHPGAGLCRHAADVPQRHGFRRQQRHDRLYAHLRLADRQRGVVTAIAACSAAALALTLLGCRVLLQSRFGVLMIAARDDEVRLRTLGYDTLLLKLAVWCLSGADRALAGMLYVPQVGIINPRLLAPDLSLEIAVWVAIGGRGHLIGAVIGAVLVNALKFWLSAAAPELWPFILSGLIVLVALCSRMGWSISPSSDFIVR